MDSSCNTNSVVPQAAVVVRAARGCLWMCFKRVLRKGTVVQTCFLGGWDHVGLSLNTWGSGWWRREEGSGRTRPAVLERDSRGERRRREGSGGGGGKRGCSGSLLVRRERRSGKGGRCSLRWGRRHELRGVERSGSRGWRWRRKRGRCRGGVLERLIDCWSPSARRELLDLGVAWDLHRQERVGKSSRTHSIRTNMQRAFQTYRKF